MGSKLCGCNKEEQEQQEQNVFNYLIKIFIIVR